MDATIVFNYRTHEESHKIPMIFDWDKLAIVNNKELVCTTKLNNITLKIKDAEFHGSVHGDTEGFNLGKFKKGSIRLGFTI
jgi:hypothetical protein